MKTYKLIESHAYSLGEEWQSWSLHVELYQYYDNYYFSLFDPDEPENIITSSIVSPATAKDLETYILDNIFRNQYLDNISEFYQTLQSGTYNCFKIVCRYNHQKTEEIDEWQELSAEEVEKIHEWRKEKK